MKLLAIFVLSLLLISCGGPPQAAVMPEKYSILTVNDLPSNSEHYWIETDAIVVDGSGKTMIDSSAKVVPAKDATHILEIYRQQGSIHLIVHGETKWRYWPKNLQNVVEVTNGDIPVENEKSIYGY